MKRAGNVTESAARAMVTAAFFERLAHHFQHVALKFRQLVEKQHAVVPQRNFARAAESRRRRSVRRR